MTGFMDRSTVPGRNNLRQPARRAGAVMWSIQSMAERFPAAPGLFLIKFRDEIVQLIHTWDPEKMK